MWDFFCNFALANISKIMKAIFINGSPRKNKNTAQMLEAAMKGAQEAGAEVEMIHLYGLNYKGCQ